MQEPKKKKNPLWVVISDEAGVLGVCENEGQPNQEKTEGGGVSKGSPRKRRMYFRL